MVAIEDRGGVVVVVVVDAMDVHPSSRRRQYHFRCPAYRHRDRLDQRHCSTDRHWHCQRADWWKNQQHHPVAVVEKVVVVVGVEEVDPPMTTKRMSLLSVALVQKYPLLLLPGGCWYPMALVGDRPNQKYHWEDHCPSHLNGLGANPPMGSCCCCCSLPMGHPDLLLLLVTQIAME